MQQTSNLTQPICDKSSYFFVWAELKMDWIIQVENICKKYQITLIFICIS